jgi:DNA primase
MYESKAEVLEIKQKLSIVELLNRYGVSLRKSGRVYKGLCPLPGHKENTGSFFVYPLTNSCYCYGCKRGGDIFNIVEYMEGITGFVEQKSQLASYAGIPLSPRNAETAKKIAVEKDLFSINQDLQNIFHSNVDAEQVRKYMIEERGLKRETLVDFGIGYANLPKSTVEVESLKRVGLYSESFFLNGRITFPIRDKHGKVISFSGRVPSSETNGVPKYINGAETDLFVKGQVLYGLDVARKAIKERGRVIITEGNIDVMMAHQQGYPETVALCGTSLTNAHLTQLASIKSGLKVILIFDNDQAGSMAIDRSVSIIEQAGNLDLEFYVFCLPKNYKDLADFLVTGKNLGLPNSAMNLVDYYIRVGEIEYTPATSAKGAAKFLEFTLPFVKAIKNPLESQRYIQILAAKTSYPASFIEESMRSVRKKQIYGSRTQLLKELSDLGSGLENELLTALIHFYPESLDVRANDQEVVKSADFDDELNRSIFNTLLSSIGWCEGIDDVDNLMDVNSETYAAFSRFKLLGELTFKNEAEKKEILEGLTLTLNRIRVAQIRKAYEQVMQELEEDSEDSDELLEGGMGLAQFMKIYF